MDKLVSFYFLGIFEIFAYFSSEFTDIVADIYGHEITNLILTFLFKKYYLLTPLDCLL